MIASLLAYAAALGLAAAIPGPGVAALVGQAMGRGLKAALFLLVGIVLGDIVYLTVAIAGLAAIAQTFSAAFLVVKILGGIYLFYLALKLWKTTGSADTPAGDGRTGFGALLTGFSVTMGNPKTIVFYLALLPTVLDLQRIGPFQWLVLVGITICVLVATLAPYAILAARARAMMKRPGAIRRLNRIASAIIGATGTLILWQSRASLARRAFAS